MADDDAPDSPDPGTDAGSRARWGAKILEAFAALQSSVAELGRTAKTSSDELASLGKKVDVLEGIRKDFDVFQATATIETVYLKTWSKWALGLATVLILSLGGTAASVLSSQNALRTNDENMIKLMDTSRDGTKRELDQFGKSVGDLKQTVTDLNKTMGDMKETLADFRGLLKSFQEKTGENSSKLDRVSTTVDAIKSSMEQTKGESFSEFMTQRALLNWENLKDKVRTAKTSPLLFELKLPYESLPQARSSRPSATLATPHAEIFDSISFQIKVRRGDPNLLIISIASEEASLDAIADFLRKNKGKIPLDLTVRTPIVNK